VAVPGLVTAAATGTRGPGGSEVWRAKPQERQKTGSPGIDVGEVGVG